MDDLRAVMDAAGSERAAVYGGSEGGALSILFAATYPERVSALVLYGAYARFVWAPDYPDGVPEDVWADALPLVEASWGRGTGEGPFVNALAPSLANDPVFQKAYGRWERLSASPGAAIAILRMIHDLDVRHLLRTIRVPTLVVHRTADPAHAAGSRYLGAHIHGARVVELPGDQYYPHLGDQDRSSTRSRSSSPAFVPFLYPTARWRPCSSPTSCRRPARRHARRRRVDAHPGPARLAGSSRGRPPSRSQRSRRPAMACSLPSTALRVRVRCAQAICEAVRSLGIEVRAGLHTGEIELRGDDIGGIAVHIGQRVVSARRTGRGAGVVDGQGPGGGLGYHVRRPRISCAQGSPRRMASIRGRELISGPSPARALGRSVRARRSPSLRWSWFRLCGRVIRRPRRRALRVDG